MSQKQPLPRLPLTGEEPESDFASIDRVISEDVSEEICLSPSLAAPPDKGAGGLGKTGAGPAPNLSSIDQEEICLSPSLVKGRAGEGLVLPYNKNLTALARENRKNPTPAETKIWREILRMRQFAQYKFLRQKPIGGYIVDFYCSELRLVIEADGDSHAETVEYDLERTRFLNALGLQVVRYTNDEVMRNIEGVYADLLQRIEHWRKA